MINHLIIVAAGQACQIIQSEMDAENEKYKKLIQEFLTALTFAFPDLIVNGPSVGSPQRSPMNLNLTFPGQQIDLHIAKLTGIAFSQGAACHSGETSMSQTLAAIGLSEKNAQCTLRLSVGRLTTSADLQQTAEILIRALASK